MRQRNDRDWLGRMPVNDRPISRSLQSTTTENTTTDHDSPTYHGRILLVLQVQLQLCNTTGLGAVLRLELSPFAAQHEECQG